MKIKSKQVSILSIVAILLFTGLNSCFMYSKGATQTGVSATIQLDEDNPIQYSAIIPSPNVYSTMAIDGKNQGKFSLMNAMGDVESEINANVSGKDISFMYPWTFDNFMIDSTTDNPYIDRMDVRWLNISAFEAENETLSPFTISTLWNYYSISESDNIQIPLNSSIPIQVDIAINSLGPKLLKYNFLTNDATSPVIYSAQIISPSGKIVDTKLSGVFYNAIFFNEYIFSYFEFIANEQGIYKFLVNASHSVSSFLNLEFINYELTSLNENQLAYGGTGDELPTEDEIFKNEWKSNWYKFTGEKGDFLRFNLGNIYESTSPVITIWIPCETGYRKMTGNFGPNLVFLPTDGDVYISVEDIFYSGLYRYSILVTKVPLIQWGLNRALDSFRISADEYKALNFSVRRDHFVRINITSYRDGAPTFGDGQTPYNIFYIDSRKKGCYDVISPIKNKSQDDKNFYYYHLLEGNYRVLIYNTDQSHDGVFQITSKYQYETYDEIPINYLTYENPYPTDFTIVEFLSDEHYKDLKHGKWMGINITDPGQYKLNISLYAEDNIGSTRIAPKFDPTYIYSYDISENKYEDYKFNSELFSHDLSTNDALYIASPCKFTELEFTFKKAGTHGLVMFYIYNGTDWVYIPEIDTTNSLKQDGNIELNILPNDPIFENWEKETAENLGISNITDQKSYYWLRINCTQNFIQNSYIKSLYLINSVISGDLNVVLLKDSDNENCDFYELPKSINNELDIFDFRIGDSDAISTKGPLKIQNSSYFILNGTELNIIGIEPGYYKLLVIPDNWCHRGPISVRFAIESYAHWNARSWYNITNNPFAYPFEITSGSITDQYKYNFGNHPYDHIVGFNSTKTKWHPEWNYYILYCYAHVYNWTQLVVYKENIKNYNLYVMQNLPWVDCTGPSNEVLKLADNIEENGTVVEFGALNNFFGLIFQFNATEDMVRFRISVSQYQTPQIRAISKPLTTTGSGIMVPVQDNSMLILGITIIALIGIAVAVVGFFVWKRRR